MSHPPPDDVPSATPRRVRVRRAPRYPVFLLTGAVLGVLVAVVSGLVATPDGTDRGPLVGYLSIGLGLLGALLAGAVAVVLDRGRR